MRCWRWIPTIAGRWSAIRRATMPGSSRASPRLTTRYPARCCATGWLQCRLRSLPTDPDRGRPTRAAAGACAHCHEVRGGQRMDRLVIGVDVGTGSARAGVFDACRPLPRARASARSCWHRPLPDHAEHSSEDIWQAVCRLGARGGRALRRRPGRDRRASASTPPARWWCATATARRSRSRPPASRMGHHRLAGPSRRRGGRGMHRQRPPGARPCRRHDVARDGDPQADVAEAAPARDLGSAPACSSTSPTT